MKIEIQASGENKEEIQSALQLLAFKIAHSEPKHWSAIVGASHASAVVVKEEGE